MIKQIKNGCFAGVKAVIAVCLCLILFGTEAFAIGQSAVITLSFPVGARPTAMGEAFTGLANDANATFYNPAGLGQSPLSSSWKTHFGDSAFTAVAARSAAAFGSRNYVWAGSSSGVTRFNGKIWEKGEAFLIEGDESIRRIAQRYFVSDNKAVIDNAVFEIMKANRLGMKRYEQLVILLKPYKQELLKSDTIKFTPESFAKMIMLLPGDDLVSYHLQNQVLPKTIDAKAKKDLADNIVAAMEIDDRELEQVTELIIPFTIAIRDSVTVLAIDDAERLWIGTANGLWRYHDSKWHLYTAASAGLPSDRITSLSIASDGDLAVGTDKGLAVMKNIEWSSFTEENGLPDSYITSLAFSKKGQLYIGTPNGLARKDGSEFTVFDTASGLLSQRVNTLFADSKDQLWIGGENGVTIHSGARNWKRYRFPGSTIYSFGEQANGTIWIGSNKGVITYKSGTAVDKDGRSVDRPEWKTYHSKNALKNDNVRAISACSKDMWIATDGALHQYDHASMQVLLFYEQIMPSFRMSDLWHAYPAIIIPTEEWGTIGFFVNFINMGNNDRWSEVEEYLGQARSWEGVFGVSYGLPIKENLSLGLSAKYIHSVLDAASGGVGQTFAIDAGVLKRNFLVDKFDVGFMLQNMGPKIYYLTPEEADPIPFSLRLGTAYRPVQTPFHELTLVMDLYREVVKTYPDKTPDPFWKALWTGFLNDKDDDFKWQMQMINISTGLEYMYADFMALRSGLLVDYLGERFELSLGLGVKYANTNFDFSYIYAPDGFMGGLVNAMSGRKDGGASGARDGQWRLSFLFKL